jgi:two-component system, CAI-1 autoinducer sensor kinase/phosphatase CqsS
MWTSVLPQPYENMTLRLTVASLGVILLLRPVSDTPDAKATEWIFGIIVWLELPVFFLWLYLQNYGAPVWFGSVVAMILVYYQTTDWRIATIGLISAVAVVVLAAVANSGYAMLASAISVEQCFVFLFALYMAMVFALSSANMRRKRLDNALTTMGVVAHELRTPLAALSLLGDALRGRIVSTGDTGRNKALEDIAGRIFALTRTMNQQIDMQISNASILRLSPRKEVVSATYVVQSALSQYPFQNQRERELIRLDLKRDFDFEGSQRLFEQVLLNLMKNAFRAMAAHQHPVEKLGVCIEVSQRSNSVGTIQISDSGIGIDARLLRRIFEPFFSTQSDTGQGLGLAFCRAVISAAGGEISVSSTPGVGTTFTIVLPLASRTNNAHQRGSDR